MKVKAVIDYGRELSARLGRHRASLAAGGLAYFVVLALAPAAVVVGSVAGLLLTPTQIRDAFARLQESSPSLASNASGMTDALVGLVEHASATSFTITTIVSVIVAVYASSKVVYGIRLAQDASYGASSSDSTWLVRAFSAVITLAALLAFAALIVAATVLPRILSAFGLDSVTLMTGTAEVDGVLVVALVWILVRLTMGHLTGARERIPLQALGPVVATAVMVVATVGVGLYAQLSSTISAAVLVFGAPVVVLLWLYLCFLGLLIGAEMEAIRRGRSGRFT